MTASDLTGIFKSYILLFKNNIIFVIFEKNKILLGKLWFSLFNDEAQKLFGKPASEAKQLESNDKAVNFIFFSNFRNKHSFFSNKKAFEKMFNDQLFRTVRMKVRARSESYNEVEKVTISTLF